MESDQPTQDANTEGNVTAVIDAPEQTEAEHVTVDTDKEREGEENMTAIAKEAQANAEITAVNSGSARNDQVDSEVSQDQPPGLDEGKQETADVRETDTQLAEQGEPSVQPQEAAVSIETHAEVKSEEHEGASQSVEPDQSQLETDQSSKDKLKKDKKDKKRDKKREKKKSRQTSKDSVRKKTSTADGGETGRAYLEASLLSFFQVVDPVDNGGYLEPPVFWEILQSAEVNLQLSDDDITSLRKLVKQDETGNISYTQFSSKASELISSLYREQPVSDRHWVDLKTKDGGIVAVYNKQTGEIRNESEEQLDFLGEVIENMFQLADTQSKGYINGEEFAQLLQSDQMAAYLTEEDTLQMQQYFEAIPEDKASYSEFYPLAKELILRVYQVKDQTESEWCQLSSPRYGVFWLNKFTGATQRSIEATDSDDRQQEIAFLNQAYDKIEEINFELEQYKERNRNLENELAQANEAQEAITSQLDETGHLLDEAHTEIEIKEKELENQRAIISSKDQEMAQSLTQRAEFGQLKESLEHTENELKLMRDTVAIRDTTVAERDSDITELRRVAEAVTDKLKNAHGHVDAKDSTITSLNHKLNFEKMEAEKFEKRVVELEEKHAKVEQELSATKISLEEKISALSQARKHLKNSRERTLELEKETEKMSQAQEKLRSTESEIRTLKTFLTTKTAMIEKFKKELRETKTMVSELLEKDERRAVILADVLEKTARQYQQQVGTVRSAHGKQTLLDAVHTPVETRPASAPAIPPEGVDDTDGPEHTSPRSLKFVKSFAIEKGAGSTSPDNRAIYLSPHRGRGKSKKYKIRGRSQTLPKLPSINKISTQQKQNTFVFPTTNIIRRQHWEQDQKLSEHVPSNPQCSCELCLMNASIVGPSLLHSETGLTGQTGTSGFQSDVDAREVMLAKQMHIGQRVVVQTKKSQYDLEPQQYTGVIKYIGKVDSEYIDNRIYVGVKLDEAVGNTDGLIKGKRYFICPSKHGKLVRITSVAAVLPTKSVFYKPLHSMSKRSPYGAAAPKKSSSSSIRVV